MIKNILGLVAMLIGAIALTLTICRLVGASDIAAGIAAAMVGMVTTAAYDATFGTGSR